jgi:7tm Chemosensory receptor
MKMMTDYTIPSLKLLYYAIKISGFLPSTYDWKELKFKPSHLSTLHAVALMVFYGFFFPSVQALHYRNMSSDFDRLNLRSDLTQANVVLNWIIVLQLAFILMYGRKMRYYLNETNDFLVTTSGNLPLQPVGKRRFVQIIGRLLVIWGVYVVITLGQSLPYMKVISLKTLFAAFVFFTNVFLPSLGSKLSLIMAMIVREKFESLNKEADVVKTELNRRVGKGRSLEGEKLSEKYQKLMCLCGGLNRIFGSCNQMANFPVVCGLTSHFLSIVVVVSILII